MSTALLLLLATHSPALPSDRPGSEGEAEIDAAAAPRPTEDEAPLELGPTLVTPDGFREPIQDVPFAAQVVGRTQLRERATRTFPQAFRDVPGVVVQETAYGQGSPFVRGWTGFRNLLLVDGVRLNHAAFRDGPNQYWATVDVFGLDSLEVVKGPGAVVYGSDAIGGTVNAISRSPWDRLGPEGGSAGTLFYRHHTSENSNIGRVEAGVEAGENGAVGVGFTGKSFRDFRAGSELGDQPSTGYDAYALDLRYARRLADGIELTVGHDRVVQEDVPRTHRTVFSESWEGTTVGSDLRRDLDQQRRLTFVRVDGEGLSSGEGLDGFQVVLSYHEHEEERDRIRSSGAQEFQGFDLDSLGLRASAETLGSYGRLTYGVDWYRDTVDSFSTRNPIQGPVGDDSTYDLIGVFVQDTFAASDRLDLTAGLRGQYASADANSVSDPVSGDRIGVDEDFSKVVGSLRGVFHVDEATQVFGGVSQGFRAPNLSDLTRFDSARTDEFEIPSPDLDPEQFLSYELGVRAQGAHGSVELAAHYTDVQDLIIRRPTGDVNTDGETEVRKENAGDGHVLGLEARGTLLLRSGWSAFLQATWLDGEVETFPTAAPESETEPIDRLLPFFGGAGLRWDDEDSRTWAELAATFAAEADDLSTRDAADTSRIPPGGTPGFVVLDLRGGFDLAPGVRVDVGLENLFDEDYRVHGSGQNRPGRGLVVGLTLEL